MAASITVHLQIIKRPQLPHFSTDLDETGIKIMVYKDLYIKHSYRQSCRPLKIITASMIYFQSV